MILPYKPGTPVRLTSGYGYRTDPITGAAQEWHGGYDLVSDGDKTLCAVVGGKVVQSRRVLDTSNRTSEWGNYVCIYGDDGRVYYYCHMESRAVSVGDRVQAGDVIGVEGATGRVTGSHCHFEVRDSKGKTVNPEEILGVPNSAGRTQYSTAAEIEETDDDSDWWSEGLSWAQKNGIIFGDENGELHLDEPCTRRQMVVFLHRLHELILKEVGLK